MTAQFTRRGFLRGATPDRSANSIRPPGADAAAFGALCHDCDACHDICPEAIIAVDEGGRPVLDLATGACTFCGTCAQACPTGALDPERIVDWPWRAVIEPTCMSMNGVTCRICQDACDPRAIRFQLQTGGRAKPILDPATCTGCGACLSVCPTGSVRFETPPEPLEGTVA